MFDTGTPSVPRADDNGPVELGVGFTPSVNGQVTGIRFYKGAGNSGTHTGSLWSSSGAGSHRDLRQRDRHRLADAGPRHTGLGDRGDDVRRLVLRAAGPLRRDAQPSSPTGTPGPLTVPAAGNGRYVYGAGGGFPTGSWNSSNYFVDVVFRSGS